MQPFPPSPSTRAQFSWWLYAAFGILQPRPPAPNTPAAPQFKHCLRRAKNVVVTFNYIHIFCLPNLPRNPTSYKADGSTWLSSLSCSVLQTFLSFCLVGVAHKLSFRFLANCAKCTKMLNTCQLPSSKSVEVPKWGLCYTRKGARWRRLPRLLPAPPASLITWMPARLPGTSLKCANAKRHLHLHTKCKRNSTRALTTECGGRASRGRNWGQALCQLVGVELCVWGGGGWWGSWSSYLGALMWATRIQIQIQHYLPPLLLLPLTLPLPELCLHLLLL